MVAAQLELFYRFGNRNDSYSRAKAPSFPLQLLTFCNGETDRDTVSNKVRLDSKRLRFPTMTEFLDKKPFRGTPAVQLSSLFSLLFFALFISFSLAGAANAQEAKGGWSIDSKANLQATDEALETETKESEEQAAVEASEEAELVEQESSNAEPEIESESQLANTATNDDAIEDEASIDAINESEPVESDSESFAEETPEAAKTLTNEQNSRIKTTPVVDLDPQLKDNLERQFQRIREIQENHDAFSEKLGEAYLSYGEALKQAGRLDEAQSMYENALHITKINNGVNSIEQRPMLRAMFEMNAALGMTDKMEENVKRTIWLEKNFPDDRDDQSFDMVVRLGNHYLDRYLYRPTASETNLAYLDQAIRYLSYAVERYGDYPMDELFMPYGELALTHFLRSKIQIEVSRPTLNESRQRKLSEFDRIEPVRTSNNSFGAAERYLTQYLLKARDEGRDEDITTALLNLADLNLLFGRRVGAAQYYELAWQHAQNLPAEHSVVVGFDQPEALPSFKYALDRDEVDSHYETVYVPLTFNLDAEGRVKGFAEASADAPYPDLVKRAKRAAKRMLFRPVIENGKMIATSDINHDIKVLVRRKNTDRG